MGLRDTNPMIDSDLELIITSFEKAIVKSQDTDSVFVPFRREISTFANYPSSIVSAIDAVPLSPAPETNSKTEQEVPFIPTPEASLGEAIAPSEEGDDNNEWTEKVQNRISECVPCSDEFKRTASSADANFFKDIGEQWDTTLNESWEKLNEFDDLLKDVDIASSFCDLSPALMGQCSPDIEKMIFILSTMLNQMQTEFSLDLNIVDSYLMAALSPIFNQLAANLDLISDLALNPIRCVLNNIQYQVNHSSRLAEEARSSIIDPVRRQAYEQRQRIQQALFRNQIEASTENQSRTPRSEAELAAERARLEERRRQIDEQVTRQMRRATDRANQVFNQTRDSINGLDRFQGYLSTGTEYLEDKKDWLLGLIEEFINSGLDRWNNQLGFARSKRDILTFISIMKAVVDASKSGDISCGVGGKSLTDEEVGKIVRYWQHPAESLEIIVEDGNIITRRRPDLPSNEEASSGDRGVIVGNTDSNEVTSLSNIVSRRPIASCLKKITSDEADQIHAWIRQLDEDL